MRIDSTLPPYRRRSSAFTEIGLEGHDIILDEKMRVDRPRLSVRFRSNVSIVEPTAIESEPPTPISPNPAIVTQKSLLSQIPFAQLLMLVALIAIAFPTFGSSSSPSVLMAPVAEAMPVVPRPEGFNTLPAKRQTSQTDVCKRWSGQSAVVNGTIYYFGGRATTSADQTTDEWNNDLISIDLNKPWQISAPSSTGLPLPSGPPAVSLGTLWSSTDSLYLYGGQFSDSPVTNPVPFSLWSYEIASSTWKEHDEPKFQDGGSVQRAAEGAGISIPGLGLGYYFGGHLDGYTTAGWSQQIARVYLPSMLEFTMPGFSNSEAQSANPAGTDGVYRNVTVGNAGFPERADSVLVHIPGYGDKGIIVGLAGGSNQKSFTQMNIIDVYDIATSTWYKQATEGTYPSVRVNPCAVAATSADGTSTQIYMYGGQNLVPYGEQVQYDDIWILTVPSFTWIQVDTTGQSNPPGRAGHMCHIWNSQMVVVGGYVGQELQCDSPGTYVFNASSLRWQNGYVALAGADDLNRQKSQKDDPNALQGSYGYQVPEVVQKVVGGDAVGGATVTAPAQTPIGGPLATGRPATYTVTSGDGSAVTQTSTPGTSGSPVSSGASAGRGGVNVGAIAAGVVAGLLFIVAVYLAFCTYIYKKQLKLYKNHVALAQHNALTSETNQFTPGFVVSRPARGSNEKTSNSDRFSSDNRSANSGQAGSSGGSSSRRQADIMQHYPYDSVMAMKAAGTANSAASSEDLLRGYEPSFLGVFLNPRRSLRVVNKD